MRAACVQHARVPVVMYKNRCVGAVLMRAFLTICFVCVRAEALALSAQKSPRLRGAMIPNV
jgi:hypothetical protein